MMTGNYILCREAEDIDREQRSGLIYTPIAYRLTGSSFDYEKLFLARVIARGPGDSAMAWSETTGGPVLARERFAVEKGDLALLNLSNVSYRIHKAGRPHWVIQNRYVAGRLDEKDDLAVKPAQQFVLVKPAPERANASMAAPQGRIWVGDGSSERTDDIGHGQGILSAYGEVVDLGPGRYDEGRFIDPADRCKVGDLVLFDKSHSTLDVRIKGQGFTLVDCRQIVMAERD